MAQTLGLQPIDSFFNVYISYFFVLSFSVSLGKRPYWGVYDSKTLFLDGAKSSRLVIHLDDVCIHFGTSLLNSYLPGKKEKKKFIAYMSSFYIWLFMLLSILAAGILSFLCGKEVVLQQCLLKVRFLITGFISYMLLSMPLH